MTVKLKINGPIVGSDDKWIYEWLGIEATAPADITDNLPDNGEDVEVTINSYGGVVDAGNEIYTALMSHGGKVTVDVVMAGSAASIIAMAGKPTRISPVGQIMIHNVSMVSQGDYHDMDKASEILKKTNESLASAYTLKSGLSKEELLAKMDVETWMTAEEAKEIGFADEILFENEERPMLVANSGAGLIPEEAINKVRAMQENQEVDFSKVADAVADKVIEKMNNENEKKPEKESKSPFEKFLF